MPLGLCRQISSSPESLRCTRGDSAPLGDTTTRTDSANGRQSQTCTTSPPNRSRRTHDGDSASGIGLVPPGALPLPLPLSACKLSASSDCLLLPNDTPQLLARLAKRAPAPKPAAAPPEVEVELVPAAVGADTVGAAARGIWYDAVRRRCVCARSPPVGDPAGEGTAEPVVEPPESGEAVVVVAASEEIACSETAVVGIAFAAAAPKGMRAAEKRDEDEPRDAREPGRRGMGCAGALVVPLASPDAAVGWDGG